MITVKLNKNDYSLPTSYSEVTLAQYQLMSKIDSDGMNNTDYLLSIVSVLTGISINDLRNSNYESVKQLLSSLTYLSDININQKYIKDITINGVTYSFIGLDKLSYGDFISLETLLSDNKNYVSISDKVIAILYRSSKDEVLDYDMLDDRASMFANAITVENMFGILAFFFDYERRYLKAMKDFLEEQNRNQMMKSMSLKERMMYYLKSIFGYIVLKNWRKGTSYITKRYTR